MSAQVFISTSCVAKSSNNLESLLNDYLAASLSCIELGLAPPAKSQDLVAYLERCGGKFLIHNYFPTPPDPFVLNLASQDKTLLERSLNLCKKAINLCGTLGTPYYSVHAGYRGNISPESLGGKIKYARVVSYERAYQAFVDSLRTLVAYAENRNVSILIEPNVLPAFNLRNGRNEIALICEDWEVINLVRDVNAPGIGILLDTGHLNITAHTLGFDRETFLDRVAPYVKAVHLHDNDSKEDSHEPVEQGSWVLNVIRRPEFKHLPVVVEATFATVKDLRRHVDWLKEQLERH